MVLPDDMMVGGERVADLLREAEAAKSSRKPGETGPPPEYDCDICKDRGWIYPEGEDALARCKCQEVVTAERIEYLRFHAGLPLVASEHTFTTFKASGALEAAYRAAGELAEAAGTRWLTLSGPPGCGKTHLAHAVMMRWTERGHHGRFVLAPRLLDELRAGYQPDAEISYHDKIHELMLTPLLIIDDLGMEARTDWAGEKLDMIIDERYSMLRPLMITTNCTPSELPARIVSRLRRAVGSKLIGIDAPEYKA